MSRHDKEMELSRRGARTCRDSRDARQGAAPRSRLPVMPGLPAYLP